jgi:hypothetical protein
MPFKTEQHRLFSKAPDLHNKHSMNDTLRTASLNGQIVSRHLIFSQDITLEMSKGNVKSENFSSKLEKRSLDNMYSCLK